MRLQSKFYKLIVWALVGVFLPTNLSYAFNTPNQGCYQLLDNNITDNLDKLKPLFNDKSCRVPNIKGLAFNPQDPFNFKFFINSPSNKATDKELNRFMRYFLGFLSLPQDKLWVNLSPYEGTRIIPEELVKLDIGRDFLLEDYILKKVTAGFTHPQTNIGKRFWQDIEKITYDITKSRKVAVNTLFKVWIMPDKAVINEYIQPGSKTKRPLVIATIKEAKLRVMLEEDYFAKQNNQGIGSKSAVNKYIGAINQEVKQLFKRTILPLIEEYVNSSLDFAGLRQMYQALILANYFKVLFKDHKVYKYYFNSGKLKFLALGDEKIKDLVYQAYLASGKDGAYKSLIKESTISSKKKIMRRCFSGGIIIPKNIITEIITQTNAQGLAQDLNTRDEQVTLNLKLAVNNPLVEVNKPDQVIRLWAFDFFAFPVITFVSLLIALIGAIIMFVNESREDNPFKNIEREPEPTSKPVKKSTPGITDDFLSIYIYPKIWDRPFYKKIEEDKVITTLDYVSLTDFLSIIKRDFITLDYSDRVKIAFSLIETVFLRQKEGRVSDPNFSGDNLIIRNDKRVEIINTETNLTLEYVGEILGYLLPLKQKTEKEEQLNNLILELKNREITLENFRGKFLEIFSQLLNKDQREQSVAGLNLPETQLEEINKYKHIEIIKNSRRVFSIGDVHGYFVGLTDYLIKAKILNANDVQDVLGKKIKVACNNDGSGRYDLLGLVFSGLQEAGSLEEKRALMAKLIEKVKLVKGDVIVFTGDLIDRWMDNVEIVEFIMLLRKKAQDLGAKVVLTMGNHDHLLYKLFKILEDEPGRDYSQEEVTEIFKNVLKTSGWQKSSAMSAYMSLGSFWKIYKSYQGLKDAGVVNLFSTLPFITVIDNAVYTHAFLPLYVNSQGMPERCPSLESFDNFIEQMYYDRKSCLESERKQDWFYYCMNMQRPQQEWLINFYLSMKKTFFELVAQETKIEPEILVFAHEVRGTKFLGNGLFVNDAGMSPRYRKELNIFIPLEFIAFIPSKGEIYKKSFNANDRNDGNWDAFYNDDLSPLIFKPVVHRQEEVKAVPSSAKEEEAQKPTIDSLAPTPELTPLLKALQKTTLTDNCKRDLALDINNYNEQLINVDVESFISIVSYIIGSSKRWIRRDSQNFVSELFGYFKDSNVMLRILLASEQQKEYTKIYSPEFRLNLLCLAARSEYQYKSVEEYFKICNRLVLSVDEPLKERLESVIIQMLSKSWEAQEMFKLLVRALIREKVEASAIISLLDQILTLDPQNPYFLINKTEKFIYDWKKLGLMNMSDTVLLLGKLLEIHKQDVVIVLDKYNNFFDKEEVILASAKNKIIKDAALWFLHQYKRAGLNIDVGLEIVFAILKSNVDQAIVLKKIANDLEELRLFKDKEELEIYYQELKQQYAIDKKIISDTKGGISLEDTDVEMAYSQNREALRAISSQGVLITTKFSLDRFEGFNYSLSNHQKITTKQIQDYQQLLAN